MDAKTIERRTMIRCVQMIEHAAKEAVEQWERPGDSRDEAKVVAWDMQSTAHPICRELEMTVPECMAVDLSDEADPDHENQPLDGNLEGAKEFITAILLNQPIWPNPWGQDVAAAAWLLTDGGSRATAIPTAARTAAAEGEEAGP